MKALKYISYSLAGLWIALDIAYLTGIGELSILNIAMSVTMSAVPLVLLFIGVFHQKRVLGYVAIDWMIVSWVASLAQTIYYNMDHLQYLTVSFILQGITLLFWALWLFALRSKPVAIVVFVLANLLFVYNLLAMVSLNPFNAVSQRNLIFWVGVEQLSAACWYQCLALTALWLMLRKKAIPSSGDDQETSMPCDENVPQAIPVSAANGNVEAIRGLAQLYQQGIITEEEFQRKKTELLKQI